MSVPYYCCQTTLRAAECTAQGPRSLWSARALLTLLFLCLLYASTTLPVQAQSSRQGTATHAPLVRPDVVRPNHSPHPPSWPAAPQNTTPPVIIQLPDSVFTTPPAAVPEPRPSTRLEWGSGWQELGSTRSARERIRSEPRYHEATPARRTDTAPPDPERRPPGTE